MTNSLTPQNTPRPEGLTPGGQDEDQTSVPGNDAGMREAKERVIPFQELQSEPTPPEEARRLLVLHAKTTLAGVLLKYAPQFDFDNAAMADALAEAGAIVEVALSPPTGSAGDDETGVREVLNTAKIVVGLICNNKDKARQAINKPELWGWFCGQIAAAGVNYEVGKAQLYGLLDALAHQPPKAETPAGVGDDAVEAASAAFYDTMIGSEREFWPHHEGWAGKGKAFKAKVRGRMRTALEAALSLAPAARAGEGVERYSVPKDKHRSRIQAIGAAISRRDWSAVEQAHADIRDAFDRPDIYDLTAAPTANGEGA